MNTEGSPRPEWLSEAIEAVRLWWQAEGGDRKGRERGDTKVGQVLADPARGGGWFTLIGGGGRFDETDLEAAYLAPAAGSEHIRYNLREAMNDEGTYLVRVAAHAPQEGLYLWMRGRPAGQLVKSLLDGLERLDGSGLAAAFGRGRADPVPPAMSGGIADALNDGQRAAFTACVSPGLNLVWGPPGTGKTEVIARAIEHARAKGKSVLLVSGTNIAVDNALDRVVRRLNPGPGAMIRVGTPHLAAIAANEAVSLTALKRAYQHAKEAELHALETRIKDTRAPIEEHEAAKRRLDGFDQKAYADAHARVAASARANEARRRYLIQADAVNELLQTYRDASEQRRVSDEVAEMNHWAIDNWKQVDELHAKIQALHARRDAAVLAVHDAQTGLAAAQAGAEAIAREGLISRIRSGARRRAADDALAVADQRLRGHQSALGELDGVLSREVPRLQQEISRLVDENAEKPRDFMETICQIQLRGVNLETEAAEDYRSGRATLDTLEAEARRTAAQPGATDADRALVAEADAAGLPRFAAGLPAFASRAKEAETAVANLERDREKAERELMELGRDAEKYLVDRAGVVASTLSMLRMKPVLAKRTYDYVIVDECAAAAIPECLYAVSTATTGAVLLGDFMQNAPIPATKLRRTDPKVKRWLAPRDCFAFLGASTPGEASRDPGCVVLTEQYRFGAELTRLANDAAYGGVLRTANERARSQIVFVDVDGLGEALSGIHLDPEGGQSKWWSVGGVVSRALAQQQLDTQAATEVGIVTPYRVQAELTQSILDDSNSSTRIDVGTSHRFQGREFETVVFDMVENGSGWVAQGRAGVPSRIGGLKLFTVAATRAKHHLFLIGDGAALARASAGPLTAVRAGIDRGDITVLRVRDVIGVPEPDTLDGAARDLWDAVSQYVKYTGLYDEGSVPDMLLEHIAAARRSIWLWAPWVSTRAEEFLPALEGAMRRGVDVRVVTLPRWELESEVMVRFHDEVVKRVRRVVYLSQQHQKIVVIDGRTTFIGSMNLLSHNRHSGRREIMTVVESAAFAKHILTFERVDQLQKPPLCDKCNNRMQHVKLTKPKTDPLLRWQCRTGSARAALCSEVDFPAVSGARNQRRPRR